MNEDKWAAFLRELEAERRHTRPETLRRHGHGRASAEEIAALVEAVCPLYSVREAS